MIEWRYGEQLDWRLVLIGLSEDVSRYLERGYTPLRAASSGMLFRDRYGMPFAPNPKPRLGASARACRAVIAARLERSGSEWRVLRALQLANFNTPLVLDDDAQLRAALSSVPGIDADRIVSLIDDPEVLSAYTQDKAEARTATGSPTELQGKASNSDGAIRYTAPSLVFEAADGRRFEAGGFQPVEAYDVLSPISIRDWSERRRLWTCALLQYFEFGLTTQEVAALMTHGNDLPDRAAAEMALLELVYEGRAERMPMGGDALWVAAGRVGENGSAVAAGVRPAD